VKLVLAQMKHETNTFSPVPTPLARFGHGRELPWEGRAAYEEFKGTGTALGAFIDLAERAGAEVVLPVAAQAWPSGRVAQEAYEHIAGRIVDAVAQGCDAVLLDLHGAMVSERFEDGEGELLARIRRVAPRVPIGVAHDMHANLFPAAARVATSLAGYQTYPHVDMYETGIRAAQPILQLLRGEARPTLIFGHRPMLPHVMRQSNLDSPNHEIQDRARQMERQGALSATLFVGFPHADVPYAGVSAVVVTDADPELARRYCDELLDMAWQSRAQFVYRPEPLEVSIRKAKNLDAGPVVLLDHYDNCASGGTMDTMTVLSAMLDAGLEEAAAFAICDPQAVAQMREAGTGARVRLAARRQGRHAEPGARGLASRGRRQADPARRRSLPERWPDGARRAHGHGSDGGARHWRHRDCRDVATNRTLRHRRLPGSRHRPGRQALSDVEKPGPLASGARRDRARGRRVRRQRGMHFRLLRAPVPASAPPGLSARRDVAKAPRSAATWLTPGALSIYISHVSPRRESTMRKLLRTIAMAVVLVAPQAHAGMIGVQDPERERVKSMLERPELAAQLEKMGVSAADAKARVDAMTPEEVSQLAGRLDQLAAGGAISNQDLLLIIILLLLLIIIL